MMVSKCVLAPCQAYKKHNSFFSVDLSPYRPSKGHSSLCARAFSKGRHYRTLPASKLGLKTTILAYVSVGDEN